MFGSQVIEVAAGLVFVYLLLSIACSGLKEFVARIFNMRANTLETAIRNMLADPSNVLTERLFQHPLIAGTAPPGAKPSYISSRSFTLALFDLLAPANTTQARTLLDVRNGINQLPDTKMRATVLNLLDSAQGDLDTARKRVENWYDDSMDRVSGWYKRRAQIIIFGIGLALCCLVNCDTLMVLKELWNDQALRAAVSESARTEAMHANPNPSVADVEQIVRNNSAPPIGWKWALQGDVRGRPQSAEEWLWKVLGILFSTLAVTMGAPFWFDLLNTIMNMRLSGNPPATAPR